MGQVSRDDLISLGDAAIRLVTWETDPAQVPILRRLLQFLDEVKRRDGDLAGARAPEPFSACTGQEGIWSVSLWYENERKALVDGAGWFLSYQKERDVPPPRDESKYRQERRDFVSAGYGRPLTRAELEVVDKNPVPPDLSTSLGLPSDGMWLDACLQLGEIPRLMVSVEPDYLVKNPHAGWSNSLAPEALRRRGMRNRAEAREDLQWLDARHSTVVVRVSSDWKPRYMRESTMAQIAEWLIRVERFDAGLPTLDRTALDWWRSWAAKAARLRSLDDSSEDVWDVARRSVRPGSAAGHRKYWRQSLRSHNDDLLVRAARIVEIGRSTAYQRLKFGGRRLADFVECTDPLSRLVTFLRDHEPKGRRLPKDRRLMRGLLQEIGMSLAAARKLEYRLRAKSPGEQERAIRRAIARYKKRN